MRLSKRIIQISNITNFKSATMYGAVQCCSHLHLRAKRTKGGRSRQRNYYCLKLRNWLWSGAEIHPDILEINNFEGIISINIILGLFVYVIYSRIVTIYFVK